jgi:prepilin-type N-terminal cleavage/methylation domain-containing protein
MQRIRQRNGFSLIEILVVVTIMATLTAIGMVSYSQISKNSRDGKRKADLEQVRAALVLYRTESGEYPTSVDWSTMEPIENQISVTSMSDPRGGTYDYTSDGLTFTLCATLENAAPSTYCVRNP